MLFGLRSLEDSEDQRGFPGSHYSSSPTVHSQSFALPIMIIPSNVDHLNGQWSTSEHAQSPRSRDLPKIFSFLQFGPRIPCSWPHNDGVQRRNAAVLGRVFSLYVGLSVRGILLYFELLITTFWWMCFTGPNSKRNLRRKERVIKCTHRFFFTYTHLQSTYLQSQMNPDSY